MSTSEQTRSQCDCTDPQPRDINPIHVLQYNRVSKLGDIVRARDEQGVLLAKVSGFRKVREYDGAGPVFYQLQECIE